LKKSFWGTMYPEVSIFPGVFGGICIILAFYSMHALPINYAGLALILFAVILFILEIKIVSHGILTIGGVIALTLGSIMLIDKESFLNAMDISIELIILMVVLTTAFFLFAITFGIKAQRKKVATGNEGESRLKGYRFAGTEIINVDNNSGRLDLRKLLELLGNRGITSLLIEGGAGTSTEFIKAGLADRAVIFIAPIIIGDGIDTIGDLGIESIDQAIKLVNIKRKMSGPDNVVMGDLA